MTEQKTYAEPYRTALERLRKGWTQNVYARSATGREVRAWSRVAVCWCLRGAFNESEPTLVEDLADGNPAVWNDAHGRTQAEVIALVEKAAELDGAVK